MTVRHILSAGSGLVLAVTTAAVVVPAAAAGPPLTGTVVDTFSGVSDDVCGATAAFEGSVTGRRRLVSHGGGLPYYWAKLELRQTFTVVSTGLSFSEVATTVEKDVRATDNGDGTWTVLVLATGNATLYDGVTDKAIARNPGQIRFELLVDDAGTPEDVSDDEVQFLREVKSSTGRSDDYCDAVAPFLG